MTVTDEDNQSQIELDFRSPTPPASFSDLDEIDEDPFNESYIERRSERRKKRAKDTLYYEPPSPTSGSEVSKDSSNRSRVSDSGYSQGS